MPGGGGLSRLGFFVLGLGVSEEIGTGSGFDALDIDIKASCSGTRFPTFRIWDQYLGLYTTKLLTTCRTMDLVAAEALNCPGNMPRNKRNTMSWSRMRNKPQCSNCLDRCSGSRRQTQPQPHIHTHTLSVCLCLCLPLSLSVFFHTAKRGRTAAPPLSAYLSFFLQGVGVGCPDPQAIGPPHHPLRVSVSLSLSLSLSMSLTHSVTDSLTRSLTDTHKHTGIHPMSKFPESRAHETIRNSLVLAA